MTRLVGVVSPEDITAEETTAIAILLQNAPSSEGDDPQKLIDQLLAQPKSPGEVSTRAEWDIVMDTNAHLRKLVEPLLKDAITPEAVQQEFDERYGAQIQVRHLMVSNPQEAAKYKALLASGKDFVELIRSYSKNPDKRDGGMLPPFTIKSQKFPEAFKRVAFALKDGEVSDPVVGDGSYHLIRVERRIAPKVMKIEDMRDSIKAELQEKIVVQGQKKLRNDFAFQALARLNVTDPTLKAEFDKRLKARDQLIRDKAKIKEEMEKQRQQAPVAPPSPATSPATVPTPDAPAPDVLPPAPAESPASAPAKAPEGATTRPSPATTTPAAQP